MMQGGGGMEGVEKGLEEIRLTGFEYEILFLDAEDGEVIVNAIRKPEEHIAFGRSGQSEKRYPEERRRLKYLKEQRGLHS